MISFRSLLSLLSRYPRLPAERRRLLWTCLHLLRQANEGLKHRKTAEIQQELAKGPHLAKARAVSPADISWALGWGGKLVPEAKCLPHALVAEALLRELGSEPMLRFGVRPPSSKSASAGAKPIEAHAWVECDGEIVVGDLPDLSSYTPLEKPIEQNKTLA